MNLIQALIGNSGSPCKMHKGTAQAGNTREAYSTNVCKDDGCCCSSEEVLVMSMERRTTVIPFK